MKLISGNNLINNILHHNGALNIKFITYLKIIITNLIIWLTDKRFQEKFETPDNNYEIELDQIAI